MDRRIATVSQVNTYLKNVLDADVILQNIWIKGEISNFKLHYSGHMYMSLKDEEGVLRAVMFRGANAGLPFVPENGMQVLAHGRIGVYPRDGAYQLYVDAMEPEGVGALYMAFEQMKTRLAAEGLFAEDKKKPIPKFPNRIGIITSGTGAALQDILNIISRRWQACEVLVKSVLVQGECAAAQIADAIWEFNEKKAADVLIVGRGGGSIEDLWAFNEEVTARAVADSQIPVISAVGHETDITICDFAADLRAPTPSAAAELVVPSTQEVLKHLLDIEHRCRTLLEMRFQEKQKQIDFMKTRFMTASRKTDDLRFSLDMLTTRMENALCKLLDTKTSRLLQNAEKLDVLSPLKVLSRGYLVAKKETQTISRVGSLVEGDVIRLLFRDGVANCTVLNIEEGKHEL